MTKSLPTYCNTISAFSKFLWLSNSLALLLKVVKIIKCSNSRFRYRFMAKLQILKA